MEYIADFPGRTFEAIPNPHMRSCDKKSFCQWMALQYLERKKKRILIYDLMLLASNSSTI